MSPGKKLHSGNCGSKGIPACPNCPYCGHIRCWKHGVYRRKGFHRREVVPQAEPVAVQRYLCLAPPCKRTFSALPEEVLPYCRFFLSDLLAIEHTLAEGWSVYWVARYQWELSLGVMQRASAWIGKATDWLTSLCRETTGKMIAGFEGLIKTARKTLSWRHLTRRLFHGLYPCRAGKIFNPHNLGIKRL
jgi:hypothetical protein